MNHPLGVRIPLGSVEVLEEVKECFPGGPGIFEEGHVSPWDFDQAGSGDAVGEHRRVSGSDEPVTGGGYDQRGDTDGAEVVTYVDAERESNLLRGPGLRVRTELLDDLVYGLRRQGGQVLLGEGDAGQEPAQVTVTSGVEGRPQFQVEPERGTGMCKSDNGGKAAHELGVTGGHLDGDRRPQ